MMRSVSVGRLARVDHERLAAARARRGCGCGSARAATRCRPRRGNSRGRSRRSRRPSGSSAMRHQLVDAWPRARRAARRGARPPCTRGWGCDSRAPRAPRERRERGADGERVRHAVRAHAREHAGQVRAQLRKIEVAVGIDQHGAHSTGRPRRAARRRSRSCASAGRTAARRRAAPRPSSCSSRQRLRCPAAARRCPAAGCSLRAPG